MGDLASWQDRKREGGIESATAVVLHSTPEFAAACWAKVWKNERVKPAEGLMERFADLLRMPSGLLKASVIESKLVHWMQSQMHQPFKHPKTSSAMASMTMSCLVGDNSMPPLVLA